MMPSEDREFAFLPNGAARDYPKTAANPMTRRASSQRTLSLSAEARRRHVASLSSPAMTSTVLDSLVGVACLVFAAIATAGWALPALLRILGLAGGRLE